MREREFEQQDFLKKLVRLMDDFDRKLIAGLCAHPRKEETELHLSGSYFARTKPVERE